LLSFVIRYKERRNRDNLTITSVTDPSRDLAISKLFRDIISMSSRKLCPARGQKAIATDYLD